MDEAIIEGAVPEEKRAGMMTRVIREVVTTPALVDLLKTALEGADPEAAREFMKAAISANPELLATIVEMAPNLVNCATAAALEAAEQMNNLPAGVLDRLLPELLEKLDYSTFDKLPSAYGKLIDRTGLVEALPFIIGKTTNFGTGAMINFLKKNPNVIGDALAEVDFGQVMRAGFALMGATVRGGVSLVRCKLLGA